jgi:hypothetical protein
MSYSFKGLNTNICSLKCLLILVFSFIGVMAMTKIIRHKTAAKALASSTSEELEITDCSEVLGNT